MSKVAYELLAELRSDIGKGASRRLRHADKLPAIIYGAHKDAQSITLEHNKVLQALNHESFYSSVISINLEGQPQSVILKDLQRHAYKPKILHMDFQRINPKEKITMNIPLHFEGEETSEALQQGGMLNKHMTEVEISCLPADLPEYIKVDISKLDIGETLHLSNIVLPKNIEITALTHGEDHDLSVVSVISMPTEPQEPETESQEVESEESSTPESESDTNPDSQ